MPGIGEPDEEMQEHLLKLQQRIESGANWCYWVAALSLANLVLGFVGANWGFALGLILPDVLSTLSSSGQELSLTVRVLCNSAGLLLVGVFALLGYFARKPSRSAFVVAIVLLSLDTLLQLLVFSPASLVVHALAIFALVRGLLAWRSMEQLIN